MKKTIFIETLGNSPQIKVLDFLMENYRDGWSLMEIKKNTKVGYSTLKVLLPKLLKRKLVIIKQQVGKAKLYSINTNNIVIKHLMAFDWALVKQVVREEVK